MQLNWDLVREVLVDIEESSESERLKLRFNAIRGDDSSASIKARHAQLLHEAGFISGTLLNASEHKELFRPDLTWEGHQLLATIRSKAVWERIKQTAKDKGISLTFDAVKIAGKMALKQLMGGDDGAPTMSA